MSHNQLVPSGGPASWRSQHLRSNLRSASKLICWLALWNSLGLNWRHLVKNHHKSLTAPSLGNNDGPLEHLAEHSDSRLMFGAHCIWFSMGFRRLPFKADRTSLRGRQKDFLPQSVWSKGNTIHRCCFSVSLLPMNGLAGLGEYKRPSCLKRRCSATAN